MTHNFILSAQTYASLDFSPFISLLREAGKTVKFDKGHEIHIKPGQVMTLISGNLTGRKVDQEDFSVGVIPPNFPLGLLEKYYPHAEFEYQAISKCELIVLDADEFEKRAMENEQTRQLFMRIMLHMNMGLLQILYERNASSGYSTIRAMLERYLFRVESDRAYHEGIASFILKRTTFSKSYVFKILSSLKEGGYITVKNGKLISIDKKIPERY